MSDGQHDERPDDVTDLDEWEEEEPRGVFQTLWFRLLLVLVVVGGAAAVSAPYLLTSSPTVPEPATQATVSVPVASPPAPAAAAAPAGGSETPTSSPTAAGRATPAPVAMGTPSTEVAAATDRGAPSNDRKVLVQQKAVPTAATAPAPAPKTSVTPPPAAKSAAPAPRPETQASPATSGAAPARPRPEPGVQAAATPPPARAVATTGEPARGSAPGEHWVQVGAFRDPSAARQLAARLREQQFRVEESMARPAPSRNGAEDGTRYVVVVPTTAPDETVSRLRTLGVKAELGNEGELVTPSLPLRDAVALARTITSEGLRVQVRRMAGAVTASADGGAEVFHRVRVGAFPDRASAQVAVRALEAQGYQPFITREAR